LPNLKQEEMGVCTAAKRPLQPRGVAFPFRTTSMNFAAARRHFAMIQVL